MVDFGLYIYALEFYVFKDLLIFRFVLRSGSMAARSTIYGIALDMHCQPADCAVCLRFDFGWGLVLSGTLLCFELVVSLSCSLYQASLVSPSFTPGPP